MQKNCHYHKKFLALPLLLALVATGCDSLIYEDLEPCPTHYHLKLRYDYNMKYADAFASEVNSVAVWAFDTDGRLVWQHSEDGEALATDNYTIDVNLPDGRYDFVTWCGLASDSPFAVDNETPSSIRELGTTLSLTADSRATGVSATALPGLYHSIRRGVVIESNPGVETDNEISLSLTKDTNYFKILLQNLDGSTMKEGDFSFRITGGNTRLEHDNSYGVGDIHDYHPWSLTSAEAGVVGSTPSAGAITSVSSILAELHTSRLMADGDYELIVTRSSDSKEIIHIPLVDYLLLVKGNYHSMSDQEYLDRQDEYALTFFIDKDSNWKRTTGIYINSWHVVPPQDSTLQ